MRPLQYFEHSFLLWSPVLAGCYTGSASCFSPRARCARLPSGSGRCSAFALAHGAISQVSLSDGSVRIAGIAFGWTAPTSAFGSVVSSP